MERPNEWRKKYYKECDEIDAECRLRMKDGERVYREGDITERTANLMGRDLVQAAIEECLDMLNYTRAQIIKLRKLKQALEYDEALQRVHPTGKPRLIDDATKKSQVATGNDGCHLTA